MLTDLCTLDELAMRLRVQGGMRWRPRTAIRLGRTRSVIRSLLVYATSSSSFPASSPVVIDDVNDKVPSQSTTENKDMPFLMLFRGFEFRATVKP